MADLFISYKRDDHARVDRLASLLSDLDVDVWHDAALGAGEDWQAQIEDIAKAARCILVCWTPAAEHSLWIQRELRIAMERDVLVLAKLAPCEPPKKLAHLHFADLTDWHEDADHKGVKQLVNGIDRHLNKALDAKLEERAGGQNPEAISKLRALLVSIARKGGPPISYRDAFVQIASAWAEGTKTPFATLYGALDAIAEQNRARREPPLFALVIAPTTGIPGRGYFQKHCFLPGDLSPEDKALHAAHLRHVYTYPWPNDP
jgi:hypothetical protein